MSHDEAWAAVGLSLEIALVATTFTTLLALGLGALTLHRKWFWLDAALTTPLVLPPTVLGYVLLVVLGHDSAIGRAWYSVTGTSLVFSRAGLVVASVITSLPLVLQSTRAALEAVDPTLLQAARTLGAGPARTFVRIALPLASRGVAAGVTLGFARALGDFGVTLMVGGNLPGQTRTAALAIFDAFVADRTETATRLCLAMTGLAVVLVSVATLLGQRPHAER